MPDAVTQPLHEAAAMVFEELAFFFPEPLEGDLPADAGDGIVGVDYQGPTAGRLLLRMSAGSLAPFAANMLGVDGEPPLAAQHDALGELANVICGNLLPRITENNPPFDLGAPRRYDAWDRAFDGAGEQLARVAFQLDSGRADVIFCRR